MTLYNKNNLENFLINEIRSDLIKYNLNIHDLNQIIKHIWKFYDIDYYFIDSIEYLIDIYFNFYDENILKMKPFQFIELLKECFAIHIEEK